MGNSTSLFRSWCLPAVEGLSQPAILLTLVQFLDSLCRPRRADPFRRKVRVNLIRFIPSSDSIPTVEKGFQEAEIGVNVTASLRVAGDVISPMIDYCKTHSRETRTKLIRP